MIAISIFGLMVFSVFLIVFGTIVTIIALFVLNWGPGAAYDYTGNNMRKRQARAKKARRR